VNGRILELYENRDQDTKGLEFEFRSRPLWDDIHMFLNLTAMNPQAHFDTSMRRDPEKPQVIIGAGLLGKKWGFDYNVFWKHTFRITKATASRQQQRCSLWADFTRSI